MPAEPISYSCPHDKSLAETCPECDEEESIATSTTTTTLPFSPAIENLVDVIDYYDSSLFDTLSSEEWSDLVTYIEIGDAHAIRDMLTAAQMENHPDADLDQIIEEILAPTHDKPPLAQYDIDGGWDNEAWGKEWAGFPTTTAWVKCRHYQQAVTLPGGTVLYASSAHWDRKEDPIPDLGIYLAGSWTPDTIAFHVGCPDYGTPYLQPWQVIHIAREGLSIAGNEGRVEVGCVGGHGRTGMMLAIMAVVEQYDAGDKKVKGKAQVDFIRANYCKEAIESKEQEWYVEGIACELRGVKWPKPPPKPKPVVTKTVAKGSAATSTTTTITLPGTGTDPRILMRYMDDPCPACGHKMSHGPEAGNGCKTMDPALNKETCGCTTFHNEPCTDSPSDETHVTCEREKGHYNPQHAVMSRVYPGQPIRAWSDGDKKSTWLAVGGSSIAREGD